MCQAKDFPPFMPDGKMQWLTVKEVAELGGVTDRRIRQLCKSGELFAVKRSGVWLVFDVSAVAWAQQERKPGPKPKGQGVTADLLQE